ncbi:type II toxin-antitoxin system VapC family toxin [Nitrosophilus labii]|uniref:type II toxin-antitoxin system VapC family toxin n=1 Tax=Nitrosophilus labii TaxID=2706014 RepID=UPI001656EF1A|nr:PIN domain-containing protein [Nitrosophilus labii]
MEKIIIDSGTIIALFDKNDKFHKKVLDFLKDFKGKLYSTWPVITEVSHILDFNLQVQIDFLKWVSIGGIEIVSLDNEDLINIINYMEKYLDVPMDLADSSLIVLSNKLNIDKILTIDRDFYIYRNSKKIHLVNVLEQCKG